jgi:ABC-2 type transport system ATP-binding protein
MDEAETLSDFVYIVNAGRVIALGTPAQLAADGSGQAVRFSAPAGLDTRGLAAELGRPIDELAPGSYVVTGEVTPQVVADIAAWCAREGILTEKVLVQRQTLEDRFLELTGRSLR